MVDEVRDGGLGTADVARVVGVAERQVRDWAAGSTAPKGHNRDLLLDLHYVTQQLRDVYTRQGAETWMHGRKRSLGGRRPIDMLASTTRFWAPLSGCVRERCEAS